MRVDDEEDSTTRPETRHGERSEPSLLGELPPLRRMPGRMFRSRTLRSPPPPLPTEPSRQLPPWRGHADRNNGLGDRQRSWSPGEDHWQVELSTLEPTSDAAPQNGDASQSSAAAANTDLSIDEASTLVIRLAESCNRISMFIETLRAQAHATRNSVTTTDTLAERLAALRETEVKLNELEADFNSVEEGLHRMLDGTYPMHEPIPPGFLSNGASALRVLTEDLDKLADDLNAIRGEMGGNEEIRRPPPPTAAGLDHTSPPEARLITRRAIRDQSRRLLSVIDDMIFQCREMQGQLQWWETTRVILRARSGSYQEVRREVESLLTSLHDMKSSAVDIGLTASHAPRVGQRPDTSRTDMAILEHQVSNAKRSLERIEGMYRALQETVERGSNRDSNI